MDTEQAHMLFGQIYNAVLFAGGLLCGALFVYHIRKEPRRMLCGVLLVTALCATASGGLNLFFPGHPLNTDEYAMGQGAEILFWLTMLLLLVSFLGGIALCFNGAKMIRREGFSLAHALPLFFGVMGVGLPVFYFLPLFSRSAWILTARQLIWSVFLYVPFMLAAVLLYSLLYAALPKPKNCDFILVLGAGLKGGKTVSPLLAKRLDRGIRLWNAGGKAARFVVSGGKGSDERVSEAFAMKQYLLEQGIAEAQILMEDRSVNTAENIRFSKKMMEEQKPDYSASIVTSNYHVLRAVILAKNNGLNAQGFGGKTAFYYLPAAFIREYVAVIFQYRRLAVLYVAAAVLLSILKMIAGV